MRTLLLILMVLILISCKSEVENKLFYEDENAVLFDEKIRLEKTDELNFPIDSNVWLETCIMQFYQHKDNNLLFLFNPFNLRLDFYDFDQKKIFKSLQFQIEGSNGVGTNTELMGFFAISPDTFLIHNYQTRKLHFFDAHLHRFSTFDLPEPNESHFSTIVSHSLPVKEGGYIYFPNLYHGVSGDRLVKSQHIPALLRLDLKTSQLDFFQKRSTVYEIGYNIAGDNSYVFVTGNPTKGKIVYSFRKDHFLYAAGGADEVEKYYAGSKYFKELYPLNMNFNVGLNMENANDPSVALHIRTSPKYDKILYDKHNHLYYRIAFLPRTREEYEDGKFNFKQAIIILDNNFKKVGEWLIPQSYIPSFAFVTKDGLLMPKTSESEDQMVFSVFSPKSVEE